MVIYFGGHTSIAGGVLKGLQYIDSIGGNVSQIFLGNKLSAQLKMKTKIYDSEKIEIKKFLKEKNHLLFVHASYILNLASKPPTSQAIQYQLDSLQYDLELGDEINSSGLVVHLGNQLKLDEEEAYSNMTQCIMEVINRSKGNGRILLETSAGAGTQIGVGLEKLTYLWNLFPKKYHSRLGICVDTAHIFSSGTPINKADEVKKFFKEFETKIGLKHLYLVHLNDSKVPFNSRVDRHENLTQGYIFGNDHGKDGDIKALKSILLYLVKHDIPALLETPGDGSEKESQAGSYQYQIEMIKSLVSSYSRLPKPSVNLMKKYSSKYSRKLSTLKSSRIIKKSILSRDFKNLSGGKSPEANIEPNKTIIKLLMELGDLLKMKKDFFRGRALQTASIILREYNQKIENADQLKGIPRIGAGTREKIEEILETGTIKELDDLKRMSKSSIKNKQHTSRTYKSRILDELQTILGIGPKEAEKLFKLGVKSLEDLEEKVNKGNLELNHQQMIGLKYRKDLDKDIPRNDANKIVVDIEDAIKRNTDWKDLEIIHAGSYPSGKVASKDIDILIFDSRIKTREQMQKSTLLIDLVNYLEQEGKILATLSLGNTKFLGIVPASKSSNYVKHLDIRLIPTESRIPAYFFYTSGGKFNQMIRQVAKDKGFMLSEFELKDKNGKKVDVNSEEDIFKKIGVNFIPMEDRRAL
jgi:apurinic endonuclease APN1